MFTLSLIQSDGYGIEENLVSQKFEEFFNDTQKVRLTLATEDEIQFVEDAIFELVSIMALSIDTSFLLITHDETLRSRKLDDYDDLRFFIEESKAFDTLQGNTLHHTEVPITGNYWDIGDNYHLISAETFANPYDVMDLDDFISSNAEGAGDSREVLDAFAFKHLQLPKSTNDAIGINKIRNGEVDPSKSVVQDALDIIVKDRLTNLGASFPYMNEDELMRDFDKLARMDEVEDADLINLLKFGYDEMKNLAKSAYGKVKEVKASRAANKAEAKAEKGKGKGKGNQDSDDSDDSQNANGGNAKSGKVDNQDAETRYVADNLSDDARARLNALDRAEAKVDGLGDKAEKGADKIETLKTSLGNEKNADRKSEIEAFIKDQEAKNKDLADKIANAKEELTNAQDGAKAANAEVEKLKQEAAEQVADANIAKTKETKDSQDGEGSSNDSKEKFKQKQEQISKELKTAKFKSDEGVRKARSIASSLKDSNPHAYAKLKAEIDKRVEKLERKSE